MNDSKPPLSIWQDDAGDFSMGRLVVFIGCMLGAALALAGAILAVFGQSSGVALAGIGSGLFGTSTAVHGWQRASESRGQ